jgi:hypothetical protein
MSDITFTRPNERRLTPEQVAEAFAVDPADSRNRGRLMFLQRQFPVGSAEHGLLAALLDSAAPRPLSLPYPHPAEAPAARQSLRFDGDSKTRVPVPIDLGASELAWLASLPSEPSKVTVDDAQHLYHLANSVRSETDRRLVERHLAPVRDFHDRSAQVVAAKRTMADSGPVGLDNGVLERGVKLLAAHLGAEFPSADPAVVESEARSRLRATRDALNAERAERHTAASQVLDHQRVYFAASGVPMPAPVAPASAA